MAQKVTVLGMLIAVHSLGLVFASLFTFKWYVDNFTDVGIFGICEYYESTNGSFRRMINPMFEHKIKRDTIGNSSNNNTFAPSLKFQSRFLNRKSSEASELTEYTRTYQRCYQLLWPDKEPALQYLASKILLQL